MSIWNIINILKLWLFNFKIFMTFYYIIYILPLMLTLVLRTSLYHSFPLPLLINAFAYEFARVISFIPSQKSERFLYLLLILDNHCFTFLSHSESRGDAVSSISSAGIPITGGVIDKIETANINRFGGTQPPIRCSRIVYFYSFRTTRCCYSFIFIIIKLSC